MPIFRNPHYVNSEGFFVLYAFYLTLSADSQAQRLRDFEHRTRRVLFSLKNYWLKVLFEIDS